MIKHFVVAALTLGSALAVLPTPASAEPPWVRERDYRRWDHERWERRHDYERHAYRSGYYPPPPVYYAPPRYYERPVYAPPGVSLYVPFR